MRIKIGTLSSRDDRALGMILSEQDKLKAGGWREAESEMALPLITSSLLEDVMRRSYQKVPI